MSRSGLESLLARFPALHIGVIGDFAVDCYWTIDPAAELPSVETGKPTRPVSQQRYAAGAAGNVVVNLLALGCGSVSAFGVVGCDPWGAELRRLLDSGGADTVGLIMQGQDWDTVAYVKPHINASEQSRIDFGDFNRLHDDIADQLVERLEAALCSLDAIVINAQARAGIHSEHLRCRLTALIARYPDRIVILDSRDPQTMYRGCLLKINNLEAARYVGMSAADAGTVPRTESLKAAAALFTERDKPVFVTCGADGMMVQDHSGLTPIPAIPLGDEVDTTGAGDAALAGITAALAAGATPAQAACTGNLAAAVCATKLHQTGSASPEEILALMRRQPASSHSELPKASYHVFAS